MFIRIRDIKMPVCADKSSLLGKCADILSVDKKAIKRIEIYRRSLDARRGREISYIYTVDVYPKPDTHYKLTKSCTEITNELEYELPMTHRQTSRPVVIGFGPAGIFCALILAEAGLKPIVYEHGKRIEERVCDVERFFNEGKLNTASNIQFGEGGAGTFSDGKLNTLVNDKNYRGRYVLHQLVSAGAPEEILYEAKPHVGTDKLRECIVNIRRRIESLGGEVHFSSTMTDICANDGKVCGVTITKSDGKTHSVEADAVFMGIGHSARETFKMLKNKGLPLERKPFSVGVRIEHKQSFINSAQYKGDKSDNLPPADYKLVCHTKTGRSVYTFCMCPGGYVVAAASEDGGVVTNGMSNFSRDGENADSALLVEVYPSDFDGDDPLAGVYFQRELEKRAFVVGGGCYRAPCQTADDFLHNRPSVEVSSVAPTYPRGVTPCDLRDVLPAFITDAMQEGLSHFDSIIRGFAANGALMTAVESRSSSPVRIVRDRDSMQSVSLTGLYPIGEGAGYAGGIMSAAMDGMRAAEAYIGSVNRSSSSSES